MKPWVLVCLLGNSILGVTMVTDIKLIDGNGS